MFAEIAIIQVLAGRRHAPQRTSDLAHNPYRQHDDDDESGDHDLEHPRDHDLVLGLIGLLYGLHIGLGIFLELTDDFLYAGRSVFRRPHIDLQSFFVLTGSYEFPRLGQGIAIALPGRLSLSDIGLYLRFVRSNGLVLFPVGLELLDISFIRIDDMSMLLRVRRVLGHHIGPGSGRVE